MPDPVVPACMCGLDRRKTVHVHYAPPEGEVSFTATSGEAYRRELRRCTVDGHVVSVHAMDLSGLYSGGYADATYGEDGMRRTFERVASLPPERSDNAGRVACVLAFASERLAAAQPALLDVGSGTGVFPHRIAQAGWRVLASDPDERAVRHLREVAGVDALHADFLTAAADELGSHDVVTFNKVLEHVLDPVAMLSRAHPLLQPGGFVYAEVPDAEGAAEVGWHREEFFVDHHHVFSAASLALLALRSDLRVLSLERVQEPSTKYTLRAFLTP